MSDQLNEADCSEALHRVFEYLDGEMEPADQGKIAAHLAHCVECLRQYDVDTMVKAMVKRSCAPEPAPARRQWRYRQRCRHRGLRPWRLYFQHDRWGRPGVPGQSKWMLNSPIPVPVAGHASGRTAAARARIRTRSRPGARLSKDGP